MEIFLYKEEGCRVISPVQEGLPKDNISAVMTALKIKIDCDHALLADVMGRHGLNHLYKIFNLSLFEHRLADNEHPSNGHIVNNSRLSNCLSNMLNKRTADVTFERDHPPIVSYFDLRVTTTSTTLCRSPKFNMSYFRGFAVVQQWENLNSSFAFVRHRNCLYLRAGLFPCTSKWKLHDLIYYRSVEADEREEMRV